MRAGYHNHGHEFQELEGQLPWDVLAQNTPSGFILQIDLGNAMHGIPDPVPYLEKYADRAPICLRR